MKLKSTDQLLLTRLLSICTASNSINSFQTIQNSKPLAVVLFLLVLFFHYAEKLPYKKQHQAINV